MNKINLVLIIEDDAVVWCDSYDDNAFSPELIEHWKETDELYKAVDSLHLSPEFWEHGTICRLECYAKVYIDTEFEFDRIYNVVRLKIVEYKARELSIGEK